MTKADLIEEIINETGVEKIKVIKVVESFMDRVKSSLTKNENVYLRGFGSFIVKQRAQKTARNIRAKTTMIIPPSKVAAFKPSKEFKL